MDELTDKDYQQIKEFAHREWLKIPNTKKI